MWVLFSAYPEKHADGSLKSVFGSITNISNQKWAEGLQKRKMEEVSSLLQSRLSNYSVPTTMRLFYATS